MASLTIEQINAGVNLRLAMLKLQDVDSSVVDWEVAKGVNEIKSQVNREDLPTPMLEYVVDWIVGGVLNTVTETSEISDATLEAGIKMMKMGDTQYEFQGQKTKNDQLAMLADYFRSRHSSVVGRYRKLVW